MKPDNWNKVSEILLDCLEIDVADRQAYLDRLELSTDLRGEVETLLAFEASVESSMNFSAVDFSKDFFDGKDKEVAVVGQQFGIYRVVRELGYGGMGAVYLAERSDGKFSQTVALKVLKREMNTAALRKRFQQEREILASFEHPNIARLLDAGTTEDSIPYLAMEYVEGFPIDVYCDRNKLDIEKRLDLFREVCSVVDFAHRNLIVHRDLKPSNILVTNDGMPKLLDFGISKILSSDLEDLNSATITKLGVMTPSYASPEQIQSKSVTTATDIYSLGVILYELLSGHRPFEATEGDLRQIYRAIVETDPPPPSSWSMRTSAADRVIKRLEFSDEGRDRDQPSPETRTQRLPDQITNASKIRTERQFAIRNPQLRGDLDNIVLKALRKEPERRYLSAENFSEDIKRHLQGLPVSARPNTFSYRAEKFIKRNKASAIAAVLIAMAIVGGLIATLWQARVAQAERVKAERRFNDVRTLANSFLFDLAPKIEKLPGATPAREQLISLALEYLDSLSKEASDDLELQRELASAYEKVGDLQGNQMVSNLGDTQRAAKSYDKALEIRQKIFDKQPDDLTAMSDLASSLAKVSTIQMQVGTSEQVREYFKRSLDLREEIARRNPNDFEARKNLAIAIRGQAQLLYSDAKYMESVEYYERANDINEQLMQEQPGRSEVAENHAYMYVDIGEAQGWDNDLESAEISLKKALDLLTPLAEKEPNNQMLQRSLMLAYSKKASSTIETKDYKKAVSEYGKAVEIAEKALKADPQNFRAKWDVVIMTKNMADAIAYQGKTQEALNILGTLLQRAEEISEGDRNNPKNLYEIAVIRFKIGEAYVGLKDYQDALVILKRSKDNFQTVVALDPKYRFAIRTIHLTTLSIADAYAAFAENRNNKELYRKALENYQTALNGFTEMKSRGEIGAYDNKLFAEIETAIKKAESKLSQ